MRRAYLRRLPTIDKNGKPTILEEVMVETAPHQATSADFLDISAKAQAKLRREILAKEISE